MANPLDILFRVKGDSSGAVKALDDTGTAADRTASKVERLNSRMRSIGEGIRGGLQSLGAIAGIGGLTDIAQQALENQAQVQGAAQRTAFSTNLADLQKNFFNEVVQRSQSLSESGGLFGNLRSVGLDIGRRVSGGSRPVSPSEEREAIELFRQYARNQPEVAQALLRSGNLDRVEYLRPRFEQELANANQGRTFMGGLSQGNVTINNYHPLGPGPSEVDRAQSRYQRVNGQPRR